MRLARKSLGYLFTDCTVEQQEGEGFQPRKDLPPWPLGDPIDWNADPFNDRNWVLNLHSWRLMDPYIERYYQTEEGPISPASSRQP